MMFRAGLVRGTFKFCCASLLCDASVLLLVCPAASVAEVTASPERKSLRFMEPLAFHDYKNAEGYQMREPGTSGRAGFGSWLLAFGSWLLARDCVPLGATVRVFQTKLNTKY